MPKITIETTLEEQEAVLEVIKKHEGEVIPVRVLAEESGLKQSRARYALEDLLESGKVLRTPVKQFNKHYVRYSYTCSE